GLDLGHGQAACGQGGAGFLLDAFDQQGVAGRSCGTGDAGGTGQGEQGDDLEAHGKVLVDGRPIVERCGPEGAAEAAKAVTIAASQDRGFRRSHQASTTKKAAFPRPPWATCAKTQRWRALKRGLDLQITKILPRRRTTLQSR